MNSGKMAEIKASIGAEMHKIYRLKTHVVVLAVALSLLLVVLVIEFAAMRYIAQQAQAQGKVMPANPASVWQIFHFFCQYVNPIVIALVVAFQTGKEFEWKTFHQIQLKGQTPATYVISKLTTFFALAITTYVLQLILVLIDYGVRVAIEGQSFDLPLMQIGSDLIYSLTAISLALLLTILVVSAAVGIVLTLVYLCVLEMIIFPLLGTLFGMLEKPAVQTALSYSPMKLPERLVNSALAENYLGAVLVLVAAVLIPLFAGWLSYWVLSRRQIGLIR